MTRTNKTWWHKAVALALGLAISQAGDAFAKGPFGGGFPNPGKVIQQQQHDAMKHLHNATQHAKQSAQKAGHTARSHASKGVEQLGRTANTVHSAASKAHHQSGNAARSAANHMHSTTSNKFRKPSEMIQSNKPNSVFPPMNTANQRQMQQNRANLVNTINNALQQPRQNANPLKHQQQHSNPLRNLRTTTPGIRSRVPQGTPRHPGTLNVPQVGSGSLKESTQNLFQTTQNRANVPTGIVNQLTTGQRTPVRHLKDLNKQGPSGLNAAQSESTMNLFTTQPVQDLDKLNQSTTKLIVDTASGVDSVLHQKTIEPLPPRQKTNDEEPSIEVSDTEIIVRKNPPPTQDSTNQNQQQLDSKAEALILAATIAGLAQSAIANGTPQIIEEGMPVTDPNNGVIVTDPGNVSTEVVADPPVNAPAEYTTIISNLTEQPLTYSVRRAGTSWGTYTLPAGEKHKYVVPAEEMEIQFTMGSEPTTMTIPGEHAYAFATDGGQLGLFLADDEE